MWAGVTTQFCSVLFQNVLRCEYAYQKFIKPHSFLQNRIKMLFYEQIKIQIELSQNKSFNYCWMCNVCVLEQTTIMEAGKYKAEGDIVLHSGSSTNWLSQKQGGNNHCSFKYHLGISSKSETQPKHSTGRTSQLCSWSMQRERRRYDFEMRVDIFQGRG